MNEFEQDFLERYDSGYKFAEFELNELRFELQEVETTFDEPRRWIRTATTIFLVADRYFALEWENGLTEMQENQFYNQPYEVTKKEYAKTVIVTEWIKKE